MTVNVILHSGTILTRWLTDSVTICLIQLKSIAFLLKRKAAVSLLEMIFFCFPIQVKLAINRTTTHNCQLHLSLSIKIKIILSIICELLGYEYACVYKRYYIFLSRTIQFIINIKLHTPDVFKQSDTTPRRAQYNINIHVIKRIYLPLILQVWYHRMIAPT
jgi:hypothetical protein